MMMIPEMRFHPVTPLVLGMWMVALLSLAMFPVAWHYRNRTGGKGLLLLLTSMIIWNIFSSMEYLSVTLEAKFFWMRLAYLGICTAPSAGVLVGRIFCGDDHPLPKWAAVIMAGIPASTGLIIFTNHFHGLMWQAMSIDPVSGVIVPEYGVWFHVWWVYSYVALLTMMFLIVRAIVLQRGKYRWQAVGMMFAVLPPWIANVMYLTNVGAAGHAHFDLTPLAMGVTVLALALNHWFFHFLDHVPVARNQVLESMNQGVLVVDEGFVILDANPALAEMLHTERAAMLGKNIINDFPYLKEHLPSIIMAKGERHHEILLKDFGYLNVKISPLRRRGVTQPGWVVLVDDITERKQAEQALLKAHDELRTKVNALQQAQNTIKSLGELVPICAWCGRRIQQEDGTWIEVDRFIEEHSHAAMTHGICPDCVDNL